MKLGEVLRSLGPITETPDESYHADSNPHYPETSMTLAERWQLNIDNLRRRLVDGPSISKAKIGKRREALDLLMEKMERLGVPIKSTPLPEEPLFKTRSL